VLEFIQGGLDAAHVPYSYGFSIISLTLLVKIATFPLTKQQVWTCVEGREGVRARDTLK
jgi:YidC/Oxa1 family membrane protein insertase